MCAIAATTTPSDPSPGFPPRKPPPTTPRTWSPSNARAFWHDPAAGRLTVEQFLPDWQDALDVDIRTSENYGSILRNHIRPRWGTTAIADIKNLKVQAWGKELRAGGLAPVTVAGIVKLLSLILSDAADEKLITANPIRPRRRGRRRHSTRPREKVWAEPADALRVADQVAAQYGPGGAVLEVTAAWTGARWGELAGLQRRNLRLFDDDTGHFTIDPDIGSLHESASGRLWLGPPKTEASARTVTLAPFNVRLLRAHLATHDHSHVFISPEGDLLRRSNFARRAQRPAADGNLAANNPRLRLHPVKPGLTFHGLRHSHKTWMIADGIPEIAQALRLGHLLKDPVQHTYSPCRRRGRSPPGPTPSRPLGESSRQPPPRPRHHVAGSRVTWL
ncbi:tyrosine-type recombinase/integrase [Actinokineospora sp. NPDC004072]